jgi:hypothetical protein
VLTVVGESDGVFGKGGVIRLLDLSARVERTTALPAHAE